MTSRIARAAGLQLLLLAAACGGADHATTGSSDGGREGGATGDAETRTDAEADAGATGSDAGPDAPLTRTLVAFTSPDGVSVPSGYGTKPGTCAQATRDTSSCRASRAALGLAGNWLAFSCNVVLGLATSSQQVTTSLANATYVTLTTTDLPDHASNYYPTSGSYDFAAYGYTVTGTFAALEKPFLTYFPDPNTIRPKSVTMYVPLAPQAAAPESQTMDGPNGGAVGMAIDGVVMFDSVAGNTDDIFAEAASFDECGGHPAPGGAFHYHAEPYSITYDDDHLVGVMRDGFFLYGRHDADGSTPGSLAAQASAGSGPDNLLYVYGGHTGAAPSADDESAFHYHLTEWKGCFDEQLGGNLPPTVGADDGAAYDPAGTFDQPATTTCNGQWTDAWFLTGHGNGGTFMRVPQGIGSQAPAQTQAAVRYFYGAPGPCSGCTGM